jgi:hypothetical protein
LATSIIESRGRARVHVSGKADRAEGFLRLRDTDTHSSPSVRSNSSSDKRFCYQRASPDTRNKRKRNTALQRDDSMFGPRRPQKTYAYYRRTDPAGSDVDGGGCHTRVSGHQDPGANIITRCVGTKSHTYDESWHRIECHIFTI